MGIDMFVIRGGPLCPNPDGATRGIACGGCIIPIGMPSGAPRGAIMPGGIGGIAG